ncbi:cytochrome P450 [Lentinus brumalis]|uniref:Cytochrome P450 n=1 Tax=Lentinus brumalis TaxID=2498619 RepID=A0A371CYC5_9APHY|nr:cytochrome P450 [Polyporus brumalis]
MSSILSSIIGSRNKHLPPGPPGLPIIGNLKDIPSTEQWKYFHEQSQKYNCDINTYRVLNKTIIVLNSREAIEALFEKEVEHYSDKPGRRMANISDLTMTLPFMNTGDVFSNARKQFHLGIGPSAVHQYDRDYEASSLQFLQALAKDPECKNLDTTIDDSLGHIFLKVSTGYHGEQTETILQQMNNLAHFAADVLGDKYQIFDILPFLSWAPTWAPGVGQKLKYGEQWKKQLHSTAATTVKIMQESKDEGRMSVMSNVYSAEDKDDRSSMIAVTMNAGGMLATESATLTFLLAMARFPEIQKRAQAEVDAVCGDRLPTLADRPNLPFVDAVLSEVLRWVSIAPVMTQDDHYKEYLIPKGATIMANNWAISRDAEMYPEPEAFRPERWLGDAGKELLPVMKYAFGFGQRTCPGRYLADALLFSHYAHILRVFDVSLPPAAEKAKVAADERMKVKSNGAACRVEEVYVTLAPRSEAASALINQKPAAAPANGHANGNAAH